MKGDDTRCTITILDNDRAGTIQFKDTVVHARPDQRTVEVTLKRIDGADGQLTVKVSTRTGGFQLNDRQPA